MHRQLAIIGGAVSVGVAGGCASVILTYTSAWAEEIFAQYSLMIIGILVAPFLTWLLYRVTHVDINTSTYGVLRATQAGNHTSPALALDIIAGTFLTLVSGGAVGKEGAAIQAGAAFSSGVARVLRLPSAVIPYAIAAGMAGAFSALMLAPLAAILFIIEIIKFNDEQIRAPYLLMIPVASFVAYAVARLCNVGLPWQVLSEGVSATSTAQIALIALGSLLAALFAMLFVASMKVISGTTSILLARPWLRYLVGAVVVLAFVLVTHGVYSGTGLREITAVMHGSVFSVVDVVLKIALCALCLGFGFKGGEILPVFCLGALCGAWWAPIVGVDVVFMGAICLVAAFGAATGAPLAALVFGVEVFGFAALPYFVFAAVVGALFSRFLNLYDGKTFTLGVPLDRP